MGKTHEECFEVGKFYKDGDGRICQVIQKRTDDGKLLIRMDNLAGGYTDYWHEADGSYGRLYSYSLVPGETTADGTPSAASFEAGKYYSDKAGHLCFVAAATEDYLEVSLWHDHTWGAAIRHNLDGSFTNGSKYDLVPGAVLASTIGVLYQRVGVTAAAAEAGSTSQPLLDPSSQRDANHLPLPVPGHKDFDSFPDLADWGVTSGTQEQPKPASGWWARG